MRIDAIHKIVVVGGAVKHQELQRGAGNRRGRVPPRRPGPIQARDRIRQLGGPGNRFIHGFGKVGQELDSLAFHHHWLRLQALGLGLGLGKDLGNCSINTVANETLP